MISEDIEPYSLASFSLEASFFLEGGIPEWISQGPAVFLCSDYSTAKGIYDAFSFFQNILKKSNPLFNQKSVFFCEDIIPLSILYDIRNNHNSAIILTPSSFFSGVPDYENIERSFLSFKKGSAFSMDKLTKTLLGFGYERVNQVENYNEFAVRGGIVDIYAPESPFPARMDFFDEIIESIRYFNLNSQRSFQDINSFAVFPENQDFIERRLNLLNVLEKPVLFFENPLEGFKGFLERGGNSSFFLKGLENAFKIFSFDARKSEILSCKKGSIDSCDTLFKYTGNFKRPLFIKNFKYENGELNHNLIRKTFLKLFERKYRVVLSVKNEVHRERMKGIFSSAGIEEGDGFSIETGGISSGLISRKYRLLVFTGEELFRQHLDILDYEGIKQPAGIDYFEPLRDISPGDFVVHDEFGIGKFKGIKRISANRTESDYFELVFEGGDKVYLSAEKIYLMHKYISSSAEHEPKLSRLGTSIWKKHKRTARERINGIVEDLKVLYAKRATRRGFAFSTDDEQLREFEEDFPFEETMDQAKAINEVLSDMHLNKPMDRLICGDVGFGKTEVALRAAFKAAMDGKQVAFLAPTTILVEQHFNNFEKRLEKYPLRAAYYSRFMNRAEEKAVLEGLKNGGIDIVIGTHKLLGDKIKFHDLGLLIIDEEQKFGALQKEKIKKMRMDVDVLAMSATPIPRTLYLSLSGIRDLSIIGTPPAGRKNVITTIMEYDAQTIRQAILRETKRGGQTYFITGKISELEEIYKRLSALIPDIKIGIVHGRLNAFEIEDIMHRFYRKGYDLLLSTSIIESGLDNPNVNLIVINNAENFGLSTLYQLRGRVGRSHIQAYCYLIAGVGLNNLTGEQKKRLNSLKEYSELGSGFRLSMADLEIRGAGNILGGAQSGHIDGVGLEMCMQMLNEEIDKMKGIALPRNINPEVKTTLPVFLPDSYIEDNKTKLNIYRKLSNCVDISKIEDLKKELKDRFGKPPAEVENLIYIEALKVYMRNLRINVIDMMDPQAIMFNFHDAAAGFPEKIIKFVNDPEIARHFTVNLIEGNDSREGSFFIRFRHKGNREAGTRNDAKFILQRLDSYVNIK